MIIPGIVAHNFMAWLKRTYNYVKGVVFPTPTNGVLDTAWAVSGYTILASKIMAVPNDASFFCYLARNSGDTQTVYIRIPLTTPGNIASEDSANAHVCTLPADSSYVYTEMYNLNVFSGDIFQAVLKRTGDSSYVVCQLDCSGASAAVTELYDVNYSNVTYSVDGLHAYVAGVSTWADYDLYLLTAPYDWSSPSMLDSAVTPNGDTIYNSDEIVSQDGNYITRLDTGSFQAELYIDTLELTTPYDKSTKVTPSNGMNNHRLILSGSSTWTDLYLNFSPNGKWYIGRTLYEFFDARTFIHQVDHYLDYGDAIDPPAQATATNITELNGTTAYYSFASALTATRIVMDVFPLTGNAGLPTGVPSVTDEVFQTLDYTLTGGSIQDIGRNGSTYFDGWIKNVTIYNGATVVAQLALDEVMTGGTASDTSGNGNHATANNFVAADTVAYEDNGSAFVGPEMITPAVLASPNLAENQWAYNSGTSEWTLTGNGSRSLLEFYDSADQPSYFRIEANVVSTNGNALNFVINATGGEFVSTTGVSVFYCRKASVSRQSFHRRVGGQVVNATLKDFSFRAYLSTTTPLSLVPPTP